MRETYRILDANFNRSREALRVIEDCGRFALNDPAITAMAKNLRSDLKDVLSALPVDEMRSARDTPGDIGTEITSPTEPTRSGLPDVVIAACKRLSEALRCIEEISKFVAPPQTLTIERMRYNGYTLEKRIMSRLSTAGRFAQTRLYVIASSRYCRGCLRENVRSAIVGGADIIQLREKEVSDAALLAMAAELRELTDEMGILFVVNDRPDIAAIVGADGVHLGQGDIPVAEARKLLRPNAIVGRTTRNVAQAKAAVNEGADYIAIGPMYETDTKQVGPIVGPPMLREVTDAVDLPVVPIGGIDAEKISQLVEHGAKRVCVSRAVAGADDPKAAARAIIEALDRLVPPEPKPQQA